MEEQAKFVKLPDGRRVAYAELGCVDGSAKRCVLVVHGFASCRLAAMPGLSGVSTETLRNLGVRVVAIDRPGYGQSDPHWRQTFHSTSKDMEAIIDRLNLGKKVWLLGFSMGAAYCWAAARYIPDRIAGMALWCPAGYYWWKAIPKEERRAMLASHRAIVSCLARVLPFAMLRWYMKHFLSKQLTASSSWSANFKKEFSPVDRQCLELPGAAQQFFRNRKESLHQNKGFGMAKDIKLINQHWGYELEDVAKVFNGRIHIWQGDEDWLIPLRLQECIEKQAPKLVKLHVLRGEGHISWFCFKSDSPFQTLKTLFEEEEHECESN